MDEPGVEEVDTALAMLIANTRPIRRPHSLSKVAHWLAVARKGLGSLSTVAERVGLSEQMLRDLAAADRLSSPRAKKLCRETRNR